MKSFSPQNSEIVRPHADNLLFLWPLLLWIITMPLFMTTEKMWLAGIGISVLTAFGIFGLSQYSGRRNARIDRVTNAYLSLIESGKSNNGLDTLLKSGAAELRSRFEMNTVCNRICGRGKPHPNWLQEILPNNRLLAFVKFCAENHSDI